MIHDTLKRNYKRNRPVQRRCRREIVRRLCSYFITIECRSGLSFSYFSMYAIDLLLPLYNEWPVRIGESNFTFKRYLTLRQKILWRQHKRYKYPFLYFIQSLWLFFDVRCFQVHPLKYIFFSGTVRSNLKIDKSIHSLLKYLTLKQCMLSWDILVFPSHFVFQGKTQKISIF